MTDSDRKLKEFKAVMKRQGFDTSGNYVKQGSPAYLQIEDILQYSKKLKYKK